MNYAVIMAGGSGQRLWPLSRKSRPKQIITLYENESLLRLCVDRIKGIFSPENILVVTNAEYAHTVREHLPELPKDNILGEPVGMDTANAIGLAAAILNQRDPEAVMAVFSADQIIQPVEPLQQAVKKALAFLTEHTDALFTFGIKASFAHTGFGYLKRGKSDPALGEGIYPVEAFREKPNKTTARRYIRAGDYCWNSGMFVWHVDTILQQLAHYLPHNLDRLVRIAKAWHTPHRDELLQTEFPKLEKISIDFAVLEHAEQVYMCELDCYWVDVGSFTALAETIGKADDYQNIVAGRAEFQWLNSSHNIAISESGNHLIAAIGLEDIIVVHTDDATLICRRGETDSIKELLENIKDQGLTEYL